LLIDDLKDIKKWYQRKRLWILFIAFFALGSLFYRESVLILSEPISSWSQDFEADCAVVLTGGGARVREGFDLLSRKNIRKLIVSGVYPEAHLREIMPMWPFYGNLKEEDVVLERRSGTTYGNAQQSLPIVEALNCRDIILVTSQLHMYRSYQTFRSIYPEDMIIFKDAVIAGSVEPTIVELGLEVLKSLFYSLWAY